jgi:chromosome segregation ATPase
MTFTGLHINVTYIDLAILVLVFLSLLSFIHTRLKINKKIEEIEKKITSFKKYQDDIFESLNAKYASIKEVLVGKVIKLTLKLNELSKGLDSVLKTKESILLEVENKIKPLKVSLGETKEALRKIVQAREKDMKKLENDLSDFYKEIEKMKNDLRERTIDLEL